jgi:single-stranded-DNA-specific exonuclease
MVFDPDAPTWLLAPESPPPSFVQAVHHLLGDLSGQYLAQILWRRGLRQVDRLPDFLDPDQYQPTPAAALGPELVWAVERLQQAWQQQQRVAIWGDFDADGVTATAVLWEGLGQIFPQQQLTYFIPDRLTESHGLSRSGLERLQQQECQLIVTCDTGSSNEAELLYARELGMDVIVTDHHTLPAHRPPVVAIINPRSLPPDHPLASLSGVAVAYKFIEAVYAAWQQSFPQVSLPPLEHLLDLVAIGLVADLVELKGDCRYLAQRGIAQLQTQTNPQTMTRPGVAKLLELCQRSGDRPTDISFGIGPRINAVSRIQGDAHFCVELLTSRDRQRADQLAQLTELANSRRRELQKVTYQQVSAKLAAIDRSTTPVIVLWDEQWPLGVLGLVAGQVAQEWQRPTILLTVADGLARGSARSVGSIDLYQLVQSQAHLLHRFGGHPYTAGLSLAVDNLPLFTQAIQQQLRQQVGELGLDPAPIAVDLQVTVAELGQALFQELKRLDPCGMGNPAPKLWIRNCWFEQTQQRNIQDWKGGKVRYIKTEFELQDESCASGFPGVWWGHYREELPPGRCEVLVELERNPAKRRYEVRLLQVRSLQPLAVAPAQVDWLLDWRTGVPVDRPPQVLELTTCPTTWAELSAWLERAQQERVPLAIAYTLSKDPSPEDLWQQWVGLAKYLSRTGQPVALEQLQKRLGLSQETLQVGIEALYGVGLQVRQDQEQIHLSWSSSQTAIDPEAVGWSRARFVAAVQEEQFRRRYFAQVPFETLQALAAAAGCHGTLSRQT